MSSEWHECSLGDITQLVIDYRGKTPLKLGSDWSPSGYRALSAKNIKTGRIVQQDAIRYVDETLYKKWMKDEVTRGDILITSEAPFGQIFYWNSDEKIVLSQRLFDVRIIPEVDSQFIYYYMITPEFQSELEARATGTTVTGLRQPELMKCQVAFPDFPTQRRIASILSALDDKIAVNERINENLDEQVTLIFQHELSSKLDFDLPNGWKKSCLTGIADYLNGLAMQKFRPADGEEGLPVLKIAELRQGRCDKDSELCAPSIKTEYIIQDGDVIFSWSGSLLVDIWCGGTCGLNQHLFKVTSSKYDKWFYYCWTKHYLQRFVAMAADRATTMGHIKREALVNAEVLIPDAEKYRQVGEILQPMVDQIINNRIENRKIAEYRDLLLPELMSGKIDVSSVDYVVSSFD